eukprot:m51a1_g13683 putative C-tail anchored protein (78) ;mRNA; r:183-463
MDSAASATGSLEASCFADNAVPLAYAKLQKEMTDCNLMNPDYERCQKNDIRKTELLITCATLLCTAALALVVLLAHT